MNDTDSSERLPVVSSTDDEVVITGLTDDGEKTKITLTADEARSLTLGIRAAAEAIDGEPFFAGGWSNAAALREIATDYNRMKEGEESQL